MADESARWASRRTLGQFAGGVSAYELRARSINFEHVVVAFLERVGLGSRSTVAGGRRSSRTSPRSSHPTLHLPRGRARRPSGSDSSAIDSRKPDVDQAVVDSTRQVWTTQALADRRRNDLTRNRLTTAVQPPRTSVNRDSIRPPQPRRKPCFPSRHGNRRWSEFHTWADSLRLDMNGTIRVTTAEPVVTVVAGSATPRHID